MSNFDHTAFLDDLSRFARRLLVSKDVDDTLDDLAVSLTRNLGLTGSAVNLARGGHLSCASAIPVQIRDLEEVQITTQSGPCVDAFRSGEPVAIDDLGAVEEAWPHYRPVARRLGIAAVAGIPMRFGEERVGVVDLYSAQPRAWSGEDLSAATVMADMVTGYLVNASLIDREQQLSHQLQRALESRVVIEQAKGVIASTRGISVDDAFGLIQRHARSHHTSIRAVSDAVVNLGLRI